MGGWQGSLRSVRLRIALGRPTEVAVGGTERLDQGDAWLPSFQHPGLEQVRAEWALVCLAANIKRIGASASAS